MGLFTEGVSKAQLLERVERHLQDEARAGKRTLLIVDEAQNLGISALEELRMLSNFQAGGQALLQIFLLGQPEFRDKLATDSLEQLRQRVIATHHLGAMEAGEIEPYMTHRLRLVGWDARPLIEQPAFAEIHRLTGGIPRKVNQFASRLLLHASVEELDTIDAETVAEVGEDLEMDEARPSDDGYDSVRNLGLERRVASLEAQLEEQDRALRRVLTLLVDWVESESDAALHNAA
jgi:type II secretory pathway predicted ATPase ExeA